MNLTLRLAAEEDIPALENLIPLSARALQVPHYSPAQIEAALGPVFGVDRQLVRDGTYYVAEAGGLIVGCGGWSRRKSLFGGSQGRAGVDSPLDPALEPARVRAFFVHPDWARQGIGRSILEASERAMAASGFADAELVATLAGELLYAAVGYGVTARFEIGLNGGLTLPVVAMRKRLPMPRG